MSAAGSKLYPEHRHSIPSFVGAIDSPENGVEVWIAPLDSISSNDMFDLNAFLDSAEQTRAARYHFERDRRHFIAARGILRLLLATALKISARELVFEYGPHGKPAIAAAFNGSQELRFNVSHSGGLAIFGLTRDREIGIDIEAISRLADRGGTLSELAARILSPRELAIWRALPDDSARTTGFLRAWTRKEAYIKGTGEGLFGGLQTIEVALDAAAPQSPLVMRGSSKEEQTKREWILHDLTAPAGFVAALAVEEINP
jgi:4'-phosphopantetheinyl transferase